MRISDWSPDVCSSDLKSSLRYGDSPENNADYAVDDFDNREDQTDTRDGKDYSANATYEIDSESTDFRISGFYVRTDRSETERSFEYEDRKSTRLNSSH